MIGYLSLGRDTFDIKYAKQKIYNISKILKKLDYKISEFDKLILSQNDADKAIKYFKNKECDKYIVIQSTFTDAEFILKFTLKFNKPILFISIKEPRSGKRLRLNSICGVNLALHALGKNNKKGEFVIFNNNSRTIKEKIKDFVDRKSIGNLNYLKKVITKNKKNIIPKIEKLNLGLVGERPNGFYTCDYNELEIKNRLKTNIKKISLDTLFAESNQIFKEELNHTKNKIGNYTSGLEKLNSVELNKSLSIFHGLQNIKKEKDIDSFAIRCWPEMFTKFGCAACGPMAMLNEKKISSACEADVLGSISCRILNQINNKPSLLVDIVDLDYKKNNVVFWHCGLAPISMSNKKKSKAILHSNRKKPLLFDFAFKKGKITIFRVSKSHNKLKFFILKGIVLDEKNSFSGTSGVVSFGKSTTRIIEEFLLSGMEHHIAFTYGDIYEDLLSLGNKLKIPVYTL